jgi:uncharacterized membrane protein YhiD involved in acid resistance
MKAADLYNFLMNGNSNLTVETIAFNMAMTTILAFFIFIIYKKTFNGVLYSLSFNVTLVVIALISAMVMMLIGSNLAISLGMVGALSIVRFRSAIKEPRDLAYLFWSIAIGLASGTGAFIIAAIGSAFIAALMLLFSKAGYREHCYLLVVKGNDIDTGEIVNVLIEYGVKYKLRMKTVNSRFSEVTYEVFLRKVKEERVIDFFKAKPNIEEVNLVSFNGEIIG